MSDLSSSGTPIIQRVRYEVVKRRELTVARSERITPAMLRLTLAGEELADFSSRGFDDHIKVVVDDGQGGTVMRDYTPRRHDAAARELVIDFALHDAGPATLHAVNVKPGDRFIIAGPRGSQLIGGVRSWLLIGDETGLPAIGRKLEEMGGEARATTLVAVPSPADEQAFGSAASVESRWIHRPVSAAADPAPFLAALAQIDIAPGTFVWVAAEASVARAVRAHLTETRGHPLAWLKARGYWVQGKADSTAEFD